MKIPLLLITISISASLFAQTTKKIKKDNHLNITEEYYVLDNDPDVKEGSYVSRAFYGDWLYSEGFYKKNQKDSLWKYYDYAPDSSMAHYAKFISQTGSYKNDQKVGVWDFYNPKGEQQLKYDFTNKKLLFYKASSDTLKQTVINGTDTVKMVLDHQPIYLNGTNGIFRIIGRNLRYPKEAKEANIQGKVLIAFTIDTIGKPSNFRIKKGIGYGCDEEALHAVKLIDGEWLPAELHGKAVTVEYIMPISFTIETH
jgi:TonB family protein